MSTKAFIETARQEETCVHVLSKQFRNQQPTEASCQRIPWKKEIEMPGKFLKLDIAIIVYFDQQMGATN